jgi:inner membrane protein
MMSLTHATISMTATAIIIGTANPWLLVVSALGSQIPDLDTTESFAGRFLYPIAQFIESRYPHRSITHSFVSTFFIGLIAIPAWFLWGWQWWAAIVIGQFFGWFADTFTKQGVAAFYPSPARLVIPGNPKARMDSRSPAEWWVLCVSIMLLVATVNIISSGGLTQTMTTAMFQTADSAVDVFHHNPDKAIDVEVDGVHLPTGQTLTSAKYLVLETVGKDLVAESRTDGKLYRIGTALEAQVRASRVKVIVGSALKITAQEQVISEIGVSDWLDKIPLTAYITGYVNLDDMADVTISPDINAYETIVNQGGNILFRNAKPQDIRNQIGSQWAIQGKVVIKTRG